MIKDGAKLVESVDDILCELGPGFVARHRTEPDRSPFRHRRMGPLWNEGTVIRHSLDTGSLAGTVSGLSCTMEPPTTAVE